MILNWGLTFLMTGILYGLYKMRPNQRLFLLGLFVVSAGVVFGCSALGIKPMINLFCGVSFIFTLIGGASCVFQTILGDLHAAASRGINYFTVMMVTLCCYLCNLYF